MTCPSSAMAIPVGSLCSYPKLFGSKLVDLQV